MKQCTLCKELKDESCFYVRKTYNNYLDSVCKVCKCLQRKEHHKINKEKENTYQAIIKRTPKGRYSTLKYFAKKRKILLSITEIEYCNYIKEPCYYCDNKLGLQPETGIGLDRIDSNKGYEKGNVVSCCEFCNSTKGYLITSEEMKKIADLLISERCNNLPCNSYKLRSDLNKTRQDT